MDDGVEWQAVKWPDGARYEGLVKGELCHGLGAFYYASGDRYLGEFEDNQMQGHGVYVWASDGAVYRGQWHSSAAHGCGVKVRPESSGGALAAEEGEFVRDEWVGETPGCSAAAARAAAARADAAAEAARARPGAARAAAAAPGPEGAPKAAAEAGAAQGGPGGGGLPPPLVRLRAAALGALKKLGGGGQEAAHT